MKTFQGCNCVTRHMALWSFVLLDRSDDRFADYFENDYAMVVTIQTFECL